MEFFDWNAYCKGTKRLTIVVVAVGVARVSLYGSSTFALEEPPMSIVHFPALQS